MYTLTEFKLRENSPSVERNMWHMLKVITWNERQIEIWPIVCYCRIGPTVLAVLYTFTDSNTCTNVIHEGSSYMQQSMNAHNYNVHVKLSGNTNDNRQHTADVVNLIQCTSQSQTNNIRTAVTSVPVTSMVNDTVHSGHSYCQRYLVTYILTVCTSASAWLIIYVTLWMCINGV